MTGEDTQLANQGSSRVGSAPVVLQDEARRERKRATDRKSQRDHRERQKAYIRQLEDTVKTLRSDCTSDERVAALLAEQEKLQKANALLSSQLDRVRSIISERPDDDNNQAGDKGKISALVPASSDMAALKHGSPDSSGSSSNTATVKSIAGPPSTASFADFQGQMGLPDHVLHGDIHSQLGLEIPVSMSIGSELPGISSAETMHHPAGGVVGGASGVTPLRMGNASLGPGSGSKEPPVGMTLMSHETGNNTNMPTQSISQELPAFSPLPGPTTMPLYSQPIGAGDLHLMGMLDEARNEYRNGRFTPVSPTLRQLLSDKPYDILSFRLFHYLRGYGGMPLHLMLAILWTQYTLIRWQVVQTQAAYMQIPEFFRPLPIQCQIPHRIIIDTLAWPDMRDALIRDPGGLEIEAVSIDLLKNLSPNWNPSYNSPSSVFANLDIIQMVERECYSFEFWKVGPGFAKKYPQFSHLRTG